MNEERNTLTQEREGLVYSIKSGTGADSHDFTYKTSYALIENLIAKRETGETGDLFGDIQKVGAEQPTAEYCDRSGKRVNLSPLQLKIVMAIAEKVDALVFGKGRPAALEEYITDLPALLTKRTEEGGTFPRLKNSELLDIDLDVIALAKRVRSNSHIGGKDIKEVREEVERLSELRFRLKYRRGKEELELTSPMFNLGKSIKYTKGGKERAVIMQVRVEDIFVYDINRHFVLAPHDMLELCNRAGVNTELFYTLLLLLQSKIELHKRDARDTATGMRADLKRKKLPTEQVEELVARKWREKLTYSESLSSILRRLDTTKYTQRRKTKTGTRTYLRPERVAQDLPPAVEALINKIGIITEYYPTTGAGGDTMCNFVFNYHWLDEERRLMRGLPPEEQPQTAQG